MANLEQLCPAAALNRSLWFDTLVAFVPYKGRFGDVEVEVPPLFGDDTDEPWVKALAGGAQDVLPRGGPGTNNPEYREPKAAPDGIPGAGRDAPSWDGPEERERYMPMLVAMAETLKTEAPGLDERVAPGVTALANYALERLDRIERIYERYDNFEIPTRKEGRDSPFSRWGKGATRGPITLRDSLPQILTWSEPFYKLMPSQQNFMLQDLLDKLGSDGIDTAVVIGEATPQKWQAALRQVRDRDRALIHRLFNEAAQALWCAQFGVAQSESYEANRGNFLTTSLQMAPVGERPAGGDAEEPFDLPDLSQLVAMGAFDPPEEVEPGEGPGTAGPGPSLPTPEFGAADAPPSPVPSRAPLFIAGGIAFGGVVILTAGVLMNRTPEPSFV